MNGQKRNKSLGISLTAIAVVLGLIFTGFGYPGFLIPLIKKEQPEPVIITPEQLLDSIPPSEEEPLNVLPVGNSRAFSINPQPGVVISAEENALDYDREFTLTPYDEDKYDELDAILEENDKNMLVLQGWELDAGLADDERLPGEFHVDIDLAEIGVYEENYPYVSAYRIADDGLWYEYATVLENGHLSFDSSQNCGVVVTLLIAGGLITGGIMVINRIGSGQWISGFDTINCYEKGVGEADAKNLGKKIYNVKIKYPQIIEASKEKLTSTYNSLALPIRNKLINEAKANILAKYGQNAKFSEHNAEMKQFVAEECDKQVKEDETYKAAEKEFNESVEKAQNEQGLKFDFINTFGKYCVESYKYLKDVAKVKVPEYVVDIILKYDYNQGGVTNIYYPLCRCYVVIKGEAIMKGADTSGSTFTTLIHELLHVSQREYRFGALGNIKFDEATAQMIEFRARDYFAEITGVSDENPGRWQAYAVPLDSLTTYIDGKSVTPVISKKEGIFDNNKFGGGELGYPLCHLVDYMIKTYKPEMTFGDLFKAYEASDYRASFTSIIKEAFGMDDAGLTRAFKSFAKAKQTTFYEKAVSWYSQNNVSSSWMLSRKGFDKQGDHAVIKNQAYQITVRKIYAQKPSGDRHQNVSVLLAYDENYKELTDFELLPIGNKEYYNTKYGIMYKPKSYDSMKDLFTLEIDGGANTESVTSGYTVWTLFAPKPLGDVNVKDGLINFTLPEKSDAAKAGYIDGYRVTITCTTDGTKKEKFYKVSGSGEEISLKAKDYIGKDTELNSAKFKVSVCEYIKEASGDRSYGPESDPVDNIEAAMDETLKQMGAGSGVINISLGWQSDDDLDLHVNTPSGSEIYYSNKNAGGGVLDVDMQVSTIVSNPAEHVTFAAPDEGTYTVSVVTYTDRTEGSDSPFIVKVEIEGKSKVYRLTAGSGSTSVCTFTYGTPEPSEKGNEYLD